MQARKQGPTPSRRVGARAVRRVLLLATVLFAGCGGSGSGADADNPLATVAPRAAPAVPPVAVTVEEVTAQLSNPWSLAFLPDGSMLVTEKAGSLRRVSATGQVSAPLAGMPAVAAAGQGGLLDVVPSPDFATNRTIFFTFAEPAGNGNSRTAVGRAELGDTAVTNLTIIHRQTPARPGPIHFGSRLVFDRAGYLFVTLGDRGEGDRAQDLSTTQGKVVRIFADGSIPPDNPAFAQAGTVPGIWSYGHRNPQGAALNPASGELWISEHGPQGGDEINRILAGRNYGWPRITHGRDYGSGLPLGEGTTAPDVEPSLHYWVPVSVAPAGMAFYTGDKLAGWQGSLLVGTLAGRMLVQLTLQGDSVTGENRHLQSFGERFRDVRQGPDGYPYLLTDSGRLLRVVPQEGPLRIDGGPTGTAGDTWRHVRLPGATKYPGEGPLDR
ncbi:MAG: PQQ-dependent sugar dehydrogenase [Lautropia sp.]|nr:PQQ-dependent sugar dehydrogenase [Lautropia sp.]